MPQIYDMGHITGVRGIRDIYLNRVLVGKSAGNHMHRCELNVEMSMKYFVRKVTGFMCPRIGSRGGPHIHHLETR